MEVSILEQSLSILKFFIVGIYFGVIYESVKLLRCLILPEFTPKFQEKFIKDKYKYIIKERKSTIIHRIIVALFDILFFLIITPQMCIFVYAYCDGIVRWFVFLGTLLGLLTFKFTLGRLTGVLIQLICLYARLLYLKVSKPICNLVFKLKNKIMNVRVKKSNKKSKKKVLISYGKK